MVALVIKYLTWFTFLSLGWFVGLFVISLRYPELSLGFTEAKGQVFLMTFTCRLYTGLLGP